ncbi:MAG: energy transducer TonB [Pseudomonadota bacterium]
METTWGTNIIGDRYDRKKNANWLLRGLIGISLGVHLIAVLHVSGLYKSSMISFIELSMEDISKSVSRDIPRPRHKPKPVSVPKEIQKLKIQTRVMPSFKPIKIDNINNNYSSKMTEQISASGILKGSALDLAALDPGVSDGLKDVITKKDYFDLVQLRIESKKEYPRIAKMNRIEGRSTVEFVVGLDGSISGLSIVGTSRDRTLDNAVIEAVKKASPFPRPPLRLFSGPIPIEITVVFEIT